MGFLDDFSDSRIAAGGVWHMPIWCLEPTTYTYGRKSSVLIAFGL